jgi:predicted transcriptional regulator of viral defense system
MLSAIIKTKNMSSLTPKESEFLSKIAEKGLSIFTFEQAQALWSPPERTPDALYRLTQKGWLLRLERGIYLLIPLEAGPARAWTENGFIIAQYLVDPAAVAYWSALHYWNMTEQIPQVIFVQTTRRKQSTEIAGMKFRFVTVIDGHFFGLTSVFIAGKTAQVTDREKTLVDCAARPDLCGGIFQLAQALKSNHSQLNWDKLDQYLKQWDGGTVVKRLGYLVEALKLPNQEDRLNRWQSLISRGISLLEPGAGIHGPIRTRWQVRVNVPIT